MLHQGPPEATISFILSVMWCLWKARNDHRFNANNWTTARVLHEAQATDAAGRLTILQDQPPARS
uniref:Uncharacterized protein n=1 Tax=Arundo donax TaxID=35708 RepID=A0A0A8ZB76_ARUDO